MPSTMATTFMPAAKGSAHTPLGPIISIHLTRYTGQDANN